MTLYQKFRRLKIDFAEIGLERVGTDEPYFCTPRGARMIGCAGVDGIHYCFVRGQGEMVFAVEPMAELGHNVIPVARTFGDLLGLLLACGSMDAIQQAYRWDEEQFEEYVAENPPTDKARAIFEILRDKLGIAPVERPFAYLRALRDSYDYGRLSFSQEYLEMLESELPEEPPPQWKVTLEGDFFPERGKSGRELRVEKHFLWGDEHWYVPAVYLCSGGLVVDFCVAPEMQRVRDFFRKTQDWEEGDPGEGERQGGEDPLCVEFHPELVWNGAALSNRRGTGRVCLPGALSGSRDREAEWIVQHYGLDPNVAWALHRYTFSREGSSKEIPRSLLLRLEREKTELVVSCFRTPAPGESVVFRHPWTGVEHTLTVRGVEERKIDMDRFQNQDLEFPTHCLSMAYTLQPNLADNRFRLRDRFHGDPPRPRYADRSGGSFACCIGVIPGGDGPEEWDTEEGPVRLHRVCSSLYMEPVSTVEWKITVQEKLLPDVEERLI